MANSPFPLLALPDGVENVLLTFVSSGDGGLQSILNLRLACSTTRSWVDNLPPTEATSVFSRAQINTNSDPDSFRRFSESAPPFQVTALSLQTDGFDSNDASVEEDDLWEFFSGFWTPRLQTLELRRKDEAKAVAPSRRVLELLEFPNLRRLIWATHPIRWEESMTPLSSLNKLRSIVANNTFSENSFRTQFYSELGINNNLRSFTVDPSKEEDFTDLTKFIDLKSNQSRLEMTFNFQGIFSNLEQFRRLAESIFTSKSHIRLKVKNFTKLAEIIDSLPGHLQSAILERIEFIGRWRLKRDNLRLLGNLPQLKTLDKAMANLLVPRSINFPPGLEDLGLWTSSMGSTLFKTLPESLITFELGSHPGMTPSCFTALLNLLDECCPSLETLWIKWNMLEAGWLLTQNPFTSGGFPNLRSLTLKGELGVQVQLEFGRRAVLLAFPWDKMALCKLSLSFTGVCNTNRSLVGKELLAKILGGPSAKTLLTVEVANEVVSPDGRASLEKLRSLASDNWKEREEKEGRGEWRRLYGNTPS